MKEWKTRALPAMFLVDREGKIGRQWVGSVDRKVAEKAVTELLETPPKP